MKIIGRFLSFLGSFSLVIGLSGCALLPLESSRIPQSSGQAAPPLDWDFKEAVGVIHLHTTDSDGRLPLKQVTRLAQKQGLDFLMVTDHDSLDQEFFWSGSTLVLRETEISTNGGHLLALRLNRSIPRLQSAQRTIDQVNQQGGLSFIAHPVFPRRPWQDRDVKGITGLEIYSAKEDVLDENLLLLGAGTLLFGSDLSLGWWLDRPDKSLALWDQLSSPERPVVGIGSPDAHGLRRFGFRLGPYTPLMKLVRNHLLIKGGLSPESLYEALESGHLFVAHDRVSDPKGFQFGAVDQQGSLLGIMGDTLKWQEGIQLRAFLPSSGQMILLKDGAAAASSEGQQGFFLLEGPGVYRLEATRRGKPWIYSNPIYVVE